MHMMSHVKVCSLTTYRILLADFKELPKELYALKPYYGLSTIACPPNLL